MINPTEDFKAMLKEIPEQINTLKYLPTKNHSPKTTDPTTVLPANRRAPPLDRGKSTKNGGMWTMKHEIRSQ